VTQAYEHLVVDITPAALHYVSVAVKQYRGQFVNIKSEVLVELENFTNEIDARLQRQARGDRQSTPTGNEDLI
jgi:hypothetical protein